MKKILYTVCSANHLAHCKTMVNSFMECNSGYEIVIGLVDKTDDRFSAKEFLPCHLVEIASMGIPDFEELLYRYTVIELNCAMKVFVAEYIFRQYNPDILMYLDSDMWVKNSIGELEAKLAAHPILLTPHFTVPLPDNEARPLERDLLRSGIYNAGFMAFRRCETVTRFLQWWSGHMRGECYYNFAEGMGVDQIWLNLVPLLFEETGIVRHPGANVAYWNLHERSLSVVNDTVMVNGIHPLLFLHISGYRFDEPEKLSRHQTRFMLDDQPLLKELLAGYRELVIRNGYDTFSSMPCLYAKPVKKSTGLMKTVNQLLKPLGIKLSGV
ncbi:MAG: hypothetical protein HYU70_08885 [Bacteroidetes bacterium]|nr:hypothetical protein [Bacteroidota bacterium]